MKPRSKDSLAEFRLKLFDQQLLTNLVYSYYELHFFNIANKSKLRLLPEHTVKDYS